jgi:Bifunctional DNA primase/polymerase, N-terminal/AAA domain/Primase C terminal 1 (PriCT-1)
MRMVAQPETSGKASNRSSNISRDGGKKDKTDASEIRKVALVQPSEDAATQSVAYSAPEELNPAEKSLRFAEAEEWIASDDSPNADEPTGREKIPRVAAYLRKHYDVSLPEAIQLVIHWSNMECDRPLSAAVIGQIVERVYSGPSAVTGAEKASSANIKLEAALDAARRGFRVFPLLPNSKKPAIQAWQHAATADESRIRQWFEQSPACNIGIVLDGKSAADVDPRNGGAESLTALIEAANLKSYPTLIAETASGGYHLIFEIPDGIHLKSGSHVFGQGIDLKTGSGAYLVAPGSTIKDNPEYPHCDGEYRWAKDRPIHVMPQELIDLAKQAKQSQKSKAAGKRLVEEDEWAVARAERHIENEAAEATQGSRNPTAYKVAARLYDFGVSKATCLDMLAKWTDEKCDTPLDLAELETVADSGERNRARPIGVDHPNNGTMFDPYKTDPEKDRAHCERVKRQEADPDEQEQPAARLESFREAAEKALQASAKPLVHGVIDQGAFSTWYGPPKSYKTFALLWLGVCVSAGEQWAGHKTRRGAVVYVAMEGGGGIRRRLRAIQQKFPNLDTSAFFLFPQSIDLLHGKKGVELVAELCREATERSGLPVELVDRI